jgi:hypothetical protein
MRIAERQHDHTSAVGGGPDRSMGAPIPAMGVLHSSPSFIIVASLFGVGFASFCIERSQPGQSVAKNDEVDVRPIK